MYFCCLIICRTESLNVYFSRNFHSLAVPTTTVRSFDMNTEAESGRETTNDELFIEKEPVSVRSDTTKISKDWSCLMELVVSTIYG